MSDFNKELRNLGRTTGRRYDIDRAYRLTRPIHTRFHTDCRVCDKLRQSGSPTVPHYGQPIHDA